MLHRDAIHEEEYRGLNIYIVPDTDSMNPVEDFDMLGKQVYWHRRMNLGHCHEITNKMSQEDWLRWQVGEHLGVNNWDVYSEKYEKFENMNLEELWEEFDKYNLSIPVHAYEHGGITISASGRRAGWDSFDSGQLGFVYVSHEDILKEFSKKRIAKKLLERATQTLLAEVKTYDQYLRGEVYGYIIEDENGENLDSCWGFLGDYEYCLEEAKSAADYWAEQKEKELKLYDERMTK